MVKEQSVLEQIVLRNIQVAATVTQTYLQRRLGDGEPQAAQQDDGSQDEEQEA